MIQDREGVVQRLIWSGKQLEDEKTFADYEIQNESTIHLVLRLLSCKGSCPGSSTKEGSTVVLQHGMRIFLRNLAGKTLMYRVQPSTKIIDFKSMIQDREGVIQRLIWRGKQLEDEKIFADYEIPNESTIDLVVLRLPKL